MSFSPLSRSPVFPLFLCPPLSVVILVLNSLSHTPAFESSRPFLSPFIILSVSCASFSFSCRPSNRLSPFLFCFCLRQTTLLFEKKEGEREEREREICLSSSSFVGQERPTQPQPQPPKREVRRDQKEAQIGILRTFQRTSNYPEIENPIE